MKQNIIFILIDGCRADKIFDNKCTSKKPNIDLKNIIAASDAALSVRKMEIITILNTSVPV